MKFSPTDKKEINNLVRSIGQGYVQAFDLLYNKMYKVIYFFLLRESAKIDCIEDIISSTFLVVIQKSKSKMIYKNCFSWILTIAKFQLMYYNQKNNKISFDTERIENCGTKIDTNNIAFNHEIQKMDKQSQQLIYLLFFEKLTYFEVSKILNISVSTVKRRRNEILKHFKEKYYNEEKEL